MTEQSSDERTQQPAPAAPPAGRYGPPADPRARRRNVVTLWALGLLGLAATLWIGYGAAMTPVTWKDVGFRVVDDGTIEVTYDVIRLDPSDTVHCTLEALNSQYAQVGVLEARVDPAEDRVQRLTSTLFTTERAVTAVVELCWVVDGD
ncbi:DUF4307 domain-containing protein [Actinotalea sp. K2]|uniref:DUF4307 domain-containing protein n=1 Tax=Actinotalea sp. K2 TaxID=2939438 RepID=UPI002016C326|nr:DUF4307 domain-containing protein [Actinotalea sp. K2]MCL3862554.1 DUF4307 domain-containing protein [Actinotalea sp. K2]